MLCDCRFMKACGAHDKQWKDGRQHDAQEYLRSILGAMQVDSSDIPLVQWLCACILTHCHSSGSKQIPESLQYRSEASLQASAVQLMSSCCPSMSHTI